MKREAPLAERLFYEALRIRRVEERIIELYPSDRIQSPVHLSIGQEAVAVGICAHLRSSDLLFGNYRSHAFYLAKGGDLPRMMAELYGKATGCGSGKAGSMHLLAPEVGMTLSSAIVGSAIPHAVGAALAARTRKIDQVCVTVFGDGAMEQGVFHESMNFAALQKIPVLFVCENNGLAVHSSVSERQSFRIRDLVRAYGIDYRLCEEGWDPVAVHDAFGKSLAHSREWASPAFLEVRTFRYKEHVGIGEDFGAGYRSQAACAEWQARDPLCLREDLVARFDGEIRREIEEAVQFAETSPWPEPRELLTDVL